MTAIPKPEHEKARIALFHSKFVEGPTVREELGPCLLWTGTVGTKGYGVYRLNGQMQLVHRIAYQLDNGPMPRGRKACHKCDVKLCGRPHHIYCGTSSSNLSDAYLRQRRPQGEAHPLAKLTDEAVRVIRKSKEGQRALAEKYGVSQPTISNIKHKRAWSHVVD